VIVPTAVAEALKLTAPPGHTGLVFVGTVTGTALTVTSVVAVAVQPIPLALTVTV